MSGPIRPPLTIQTADGATSGRPINTIKVSNGDLSISGTTATIDTTGAGGAGTVTSITTGADTGTGTAITASGTFTFTGGTNVTTAVTGTVVTINSTDQYVGTVTGITSFAPLAVDNTNPAIPSLAMPQSTSGQDGWLSSTDWNTFNNKGTGTINGSILNTQVARGATTINEIEGSNGLLFDGTSLTVSTLSLSDPIINMSSTTKSLSLEVNTSNKLSVKGATNSFIFDASSGTGGITWPDSSTQLTANNAVGTVTSIGLTETGSALSISGSPITGSGTLNISGAGTSSQVILGDLSLGTLTSGTVTGTGSANQVSYWTAASVQAGSTGLTYDPSTGNLTVGGYVEVGTKITTPSGTNLTLDTHNGTASGSIVIANGANGQISINPNGSGKVKLNGVELDNTAIATGYVLKATSATAAGWSAESGGGGTIGGTIANTQVARGAVTSNEIEGDNGLLFDGTSLTVNTLSASDPIINMSSSTKSVSLEVETSQTLSIKGGSNKFIFDASSATGGITFPDSTVQLTAATGGGSSDEPNSLAAGMTNVNSELLGVGYNAPADGIPNSIQWANSLSRIRPHNMLQAGTLDNAYMWFSSAPTGASTQTFNIGLWNAGTDNKMGTLKAVATIDIIVGGSTGIQGGSWTAEAGEDLDVTLGGLYWVGFYGNYAAVGDAAGLYFLPQAGLSLFPSRRSNGSLTNTNNLTRVYASGSPSTIGDNPTIANGDSQFNATWPYMWYDLT